MMPIERGELLDLRRELESLRSDMVEAELHFGTHWQAVPERRRDSARNLLHYLALRRHDLRQLQPELTRWGLSSLGRAEPGALATVEAVLRAVSSMSGAGDELAPRTGADVARGRELLHKEAAALLGAPPAHRAVRIMVTMPSEAADEYALVRHLLASGMDAMRINAAHDDAAAWDRMLKHLDRARRELDRPCRVIVDVAGPKVRTGPVRPTVPVLRWRPRRDRLGRVVTPARIWLTAADRPAPPPDPADVVLPVRGAWLRTLNNGDTLKLFDARDAMREIAVIATGDEGVWAESRQTAYVLPGTPLHVVGRSVPAGEVGPLASTPGIIRVAKDDTLILTRELASGTPSVTDASGTVLQPARIGVTLPEVFDDVRAGEAIWLDDGSIGGVITSVAQDQLVITVTRALPGGAKLGADKGINLPDTNLRLPALTAKDREDLSFFDGRADLVGYSFVRTANDVRLLQSHLSEIGAEQLGVVLKIETRQAFENLPALLLAAMHSPAAGVMIARGDLAIECGYQRLAEVQEEILWMAEASHTPVIWATQVLETLAKEGIPSRAEITDAAMGERAECVMLNKGPYAVEAVRALDDILIRMETHQRKKSPMLRKLGLAHRFLAA